MNTHANCVDSSKLKLEVRRDVRKESDQILHRVVSRPLLRKPRCTTDLAVCRRKQQTCPPRCVPQSPYVSTTIFPPSEPASPWDVHVRAVTVQAQPELLVLEGGVLFHVPGDHLLLDELVHLTQTRSRPIPTQNPATAVLWTEFRG